MIQVPATIDNGEGEHGVSSLSLIDQGTSAVNELPEVNR
jgi:hypothetical protein